MDGGVKVDEDSHLQHVARQQLEYEGPEYDIDWEEVRRGEASGMPGKWVGTGAHITEPHIQNSILLLQDPMLWDRMETGAPTLFTIVSR